MVLGFSVLSASHAGAKVAEPDNWSLGLHNLTTFLWKASSTNSFSGRFLLSHAREPGMPAGFFAWSPPMCLPLLCSKAFQSTVPCTSTRGHMCRASSVIDDSEHDGFIRPKSCSCKSCTCRLDMRQGAMDFASSSSKPGKAMSIVLGFIRHSSSGLLMSTLVPTVLVDVRNPGRVRSTLLLSFEFRWSCSVSERRTSSMVRGAHVQHVHKTSENGRGCMPRDKRLRQAPQKRRCSKKTWGKSLNPKPNPGKPGTSTSSNKRSNLWHPAGPLYRRYLGEGFDADSSRRGLKPETLTLILNPIPKH